MVPFQGRISIPSSFVSLFIFYILSYLLSKTMGCFSGSLMSSASNQKLFCEVCSAFNCSFNEFVGEKVISPSYSSAISAPPLDFIFILFKIFPDSLVISSLTSNLEIHCLIFKYLGFVVTYSSVTDFNFNFIEHRICLVSF